jgi:hypothetical protein
MKAIRESQRQWAASVGGWSPVGRAAADADAGAAAGSDFIPNKEFYAREDELMSALFSVLGAVAM